MQFNNHEGAKIAFHFSGHGGILIWWFPLLSVVDSPPSTERNSFWEAAALPSSFLYGALTLKEKYKKYIKKGKL